ncbi:MAG: hypothetical protein MT490_03975 [Sphingomonas sp.]|uniref:hypothetical protein n=1 Tax=Sphingomonas sp. TaxID=28214 RepID=UPI002275C1BA|nr:hypothetical protein [Sphingomonas sp.]MCX8474937.1 hypothetical protein [Sphingomonas sp.]
MLLAAVMLQAGIAAPAFAPPLGAPLRIVTERTETSPDVRQYRLERLVRFAREDKGYRAEAVLLRQSAAAPEALANLVERGLAALAGRTIVVHLDDKGHVLAVEDMAALWDQVCQGVAQAAASRRSLPPGEADALAAKLVTPLRALPAERQRALLATLVTAAIMTDPWDPVGSSAPVRLPGVSPFGTPVTLEGTRSTAAAQGGLFEAISLASATVTLPAQGTAPARDGAVSLERRRTFDPRTGMLAAAIDTVRNTSGTGSTAREVLLVTKVRIEPASPDNWPR